jgi:hypothetical protein
MNQEQNINNADGQAVNVDPLVMPSFGQFVDFSTKFRRDSKRVIEKKFIRARSRE